MTHINDLPPELLSTIFSVIIELSKEGIPALTKRRSHELLDVLLVCRYWDSAACTTPSLWTTVFVTNGSTAVQRVQRYLERSGDLPLDVVVTSMTGDGQVQNTEDALQVLGGYSARWRSFATSFTTPKLNGILGMTFPNLSTFSYHPAHADVGIPTSASTPTITLDTPKLDVLIAPADTVLFKNDSWPKLKHLDIPFLWGNESWLWKVLGASQSSLEFMGVRSEIAVRITKHRFETENGNGSAVSCLPKLRCLKVRAMSDFQWTSLRFAVMPSLTHLTFDADSSAFRPFGQMLLPTFHSLQVLHFCTYANRNGADALSLLLGQAPNVTSLTITDKFRTLAHSRDNMITLLLLTDATSPQEPLVGKKLEEVRLLGFPAYVKNLKKLIDLRTRAGCLKKIVLTKGLIEVQSRSDKEDLSLLKNRVTFEEVEG